MMSIVNGYSEDKTFLSNNLISLLEWCLNYKKNVYFSITDVCNIYNVKVEYDELCSRGRYNDESYDCYLNATFKNVNHKYLHYDTLFVNSDDYPLSDVVESFRINYMKNPNLDKYLKTEELTY